VRRSGDAGANEALAWALDGDARSPLPHGAVSKPRFETQRQLSQDHSVWHRSRPRHHPASHPLLARRPPLPAPPRPYPQGIRANVPTPNLPIVDKIVKGTESLTRQLLPKCAPNQVLDMKAMSCRNCTDGSVAEMGAASCTVCGRGK
jgi:hypothetical protein